MDFQLGIDGWGYIRCRFTTAFLISLCVFTYLEKLEQRPWPVVVREADDSDVWAPTRALIQAL